MYPLAMPHMTILQEEFSVKVSVMANTFSNDEILVGHTNGNIHLWNCRNMLRGCYFANDGLEIIYLYALNLCEFLSVNRIGVAKVWNMYYSSIVRHFNLFWCNIDYLTMLPGNLLAFSIFRPPVHSQTIEVWDINTGFCAHQGFFCCPYSTGMPLAVTIAGYLVVASNFSRRMGIYDVSVASCRMVCMTKVGVVFALAALPTNEIVTASRCIVIYKLTQHGDIFRSRTIEHANIIDVIIPVAGYKFITIDRSRNHCGVLKLWISLSDKYEYLGHSKYTGYPKLVCPQHNLIVSCHQDRVFLRHFQARKFQISRQLAEIRKAVRILAQAVRTSSSLFVTLPVEILMKIAVMTACGMSEFERKVSRDIAWSHFCRPHYCETYMKEKKIVVFLPH